MTALMCMSNPLWEWIIAPATLISIGWWIHEYVDRDEARD